MKLLAFNGNSRKKWNTAQLLEPALKGAKSEGAKTKFYPCTIWISKAASAGHCVVKDDLQPIFEKIEKADAILIGSPIYLGITTGVTRCCD
jgi:multimeric flavodoxin WrbA